MESAIYIQLALIGAFAGLAIYDGLYLHLIRYRLYMHQDSRFEHLMHTVRAVLFPLILVILFLGTSAWSFYIGLVIVILDIIVLAIDAWSEKDSRAFMGGLPRWEYIIHLMVNGFHFAAIAVFLVMRIKLTDTGFILSNIMMTAENYMMYKTILINLIPGAAIIGLLHVVLIFPKPQFLFSALSNKLRCC